MFYHFIATGILMGDYQLKKHFDKTLAPNTEKLVLDNRIILRKHHNSGFIFDSLVDKHQLKHVSWSIQLILLGIYWISLFRKKGNRVTKLGAAMVLGGGLSNLYERITKGYVVDYFSFNSRFPKLKQIIFNISDLFIFLGAIFIIIARKRK